MGFVPLSNGAIFQSFPFHRPRSVFCRPPLLGFVGAFAPVPFHRLHPRRSPSRDVAITLDSSCTLESRSDLVVSHDLVGLLRRLSGFSPDSLSPFRVTKDFRAYCIPLPIVGFDAFRSPRPVEPAPGALPSLTSFLAGHTDSRVLASKFVPPGEFPPPAAVTRLRALCLLGLFVHLRSATFPTVPFPVLPFLPYRRDVVPRGFAPLVSPYHQTPYSGVRWPTLPGPCPPSRSPSCRSFRIDRAWMMPCITLAPRLQTVAVAFVPSIVSPRLLVGR